MQKMQEAWVQSLAGEDPLEEEMATHSCILAWKIKWTEEPGGLQSTGLQKVGHDWAHTHTHTHSDKIGNIPLYSSEQILERWECQLKEKWCIMTITNFLYYMSTNLAQVSFYKAFGLYIKWFIDEYSCMNGRSKPSWLGMGRGKPCCETWSM